MKGENVYIGNNPEEDKKSKAKAKIKLAMRTKIIYKKNESSIICREGKESVWAEGLKRRFGVRRTERASGLFFRSTF